MKALWRNQQEITYYLYDTTSDVVDSDGYATGEKLIKYKPGVTIRAQVAPPKGSGAQVALLKGVTSGHTFGNLMEMDRSILIDDVNCPIDVNTVLCIDKTPSYSEGIPVYDYEVQRVSKSLNHIVLGVSKVGI